MVDKRQMSYPAGIDIGSTTAKVVICDSHNRLLFARYQRHQGETVKMTREIVKEAFNELGDIPVQVSVTGSAGMGAAEAFHVPFVQEVVASARLIKDVYLDVRTFIEVGGEDSKIIFFDDNFRPDIRMNGSCAGGTGAFIDQMAVLLDVPVAEFNDLARKAACIYPIASRCGVFAKTDIQALLSRGVSREDIAASVFHATALQAISSLARGRDIQGRILFGGGPLTFCSELRKAFVDVLGVDDPKEVIIPEHSEFIPAMGAARSNNTDPYLIRLKDLIELPETVALHHTGSGTNRLAPLFQSQAEFEAWQEAHAEDRVPRADLSLTKGKGLFLGIDSGSTTTKIVLVDDEGKFVLGHYRPNNGNPLKAVEKGLIELKTGFKKTGWLPRIVRSAATGYGEDFIKAAFGLDDGVVETMAHYRAARSFERNVSFVLDIGGQDMKAIYIHDHAISDIQVNEACSSGCGSFIETFAGSLGFSVSDFAETACLSAEPFDLGTRCTVFMNSKVKQALREGASIPDISAGLAYSVIKNALHKVLKLRDTEILGDKILVQGGTFRNPAVLRALELLLKKTVIRPDIPELMGAYGAALTALENHSIYRKESSGFNPFHEPELKVNFTSKEVECHGCENQCSVTKLSFKDGNHFFTGNRCERYFTNASKVRHKGKNLVAEKSRLLFDRPVEPSTPALLTYGIPRCLNMYENFPFWTAFLVECGFKVVLSSPSSIKRYERAASTVMSDNICFPAKLAHSHILDLVEKGVDRIFYPIVVHEQEEFQDAVNSYNCPVVTGYPDVLKSAIDPEKRYGIPFDSPAIGFRDTGLLKRQLHIFFKRFGLDYASISRAVEKGLSAHRQFKKELTDRASALIKEAKKDGRMLIVMAGRPYHIDPLINHGLPDLLANMGVDVITEDAVPGVQKQSLSDINVLTQWTYANRLYAAAEWVTKEDNAQLVQIISFGCGPDTVSADEVKDILSSNGKIHTMIKMDEISNLGAVRIRLRSMLEAVKERQDRTRQPQDTPCSEHRVANHDDVKKRTYIAPYFSPFYSPLVPAAFRSIGIKVDVLPPQDRDSIEFGLKNVNNDICYPAVLIAGDIVKAFESGRYDPANTSVILTQTGGQCRASNYVALIEKALASAGIGSVPVVALSTTQLSPRSQFAIEEKDKRRLVKGMGLGVMFSDPLAQMYLATVVRERVAGASKALHAEYLSKMEPGIENADFKYLMNILQEAVRAFNAISVDNRPVPRIGVVGEIFLKYNFFANGNLIEWLSGQGVEVTLPSLQGFFTRGFINEDFNQKAFFKHCLGDRLKSRLLEIYVNYYQSQIEQVMRQFRFYPGSFNLKKLAEMSEQVVSLANQAGEGWLLTADMIDMLEQGISNIVCVQPFGCISNHITGKGLERKLREMFPHLNLLSLDMDPGASEVNILNRLHFMIIAAKEEMECGMEVTARPSTALPFYVPRIWPGYLARFDSYVSPDIEKWKSWVSGLGLWKKAGHFMRR